jgi:hypothetical protein
MMTVDQFAAILRDRRTALVCDGWFFNENLQQGYRATLSSQNRWYWFSVSNTDLELAPDEVALAITSPDRELLREGTYRNKKGALGFEATVKSADHYYMLGASNLPG